MRSFIAWFAIAAAAHAQGDRTIRISNAPTGDSGDEASSWSVISADGRFVAFVSGADDLVPGDTNRTSDVFVYDRTTSTLSRVSVDSHGVEGDGPSNFPSISADGRYVAFTSDATNLDIDLNGAITDIFVHDQSTGTTTRITASASGGGIGLGCALPSISDDGRFVAFESYSDDLVAPGPPDEFPQIYVVDCTSGLTVLVSSDANGVAANYDCHRALISGDGSCVTFTTAATNLPNGSPWHYWTPYLKTLATGAIERIDADETGTGFPSGGFNGESSGDGRYVLVETSGDLVSDDHNGRNDVYLRDRVLGTTERVSLASGRRELLGDSFSQSMTDDARFILFSSDAPDIVAGDTNGVSDLFLRDRQHDTTLRVSVGTVDEEGSGPSYWDSGRLPRTASPESAVIVFTSYSSDFAPADVNSSADVFLRERSLISATWSNYGTGFPGRSGIVPTMTLDDAPWRGALRVVACTNSSSLYTLGFVFVGLTRNSLPTRLGGVLLLDPLVTIPIALSPWGGTISAVIPDSFWANGLAVDLQTLELDPWAAKGVSFTDGLELVLGDD